MRYSEAPQTSRANQGAHGSIRTQPHPLDLKVHEQYVTLLPASPLLIAEMSFNSVLMKKEKRYSEFNIVNKKKKS